MELLRSSGIPAVLAGRYNPRAPKEILVPAKWVDDANRVIAGRDDVAPRAILAGERFANEPRSILTATSWLLAIGMAVLAALAVGRFVFAAAKSLYK